MAKSKLSNVIKNHDLFGYPIRLNFNNKGDYFQTISGGMLSICIKLFMWGFVAYKLYLMFSYGNNTILMSESLADFK